MPRRFGAVPGLHAASGTVALFENEAGVVFPEEAIRAHLDIAADNGAHVHFDERVEEWTVASSGASTCGPRAAAMNAID
jgi:sarcosine oxidase